MHINYANQKEKKPMYYCKYLFGLQTKCSGCCFCFYSFYRCAPLLPEFQPQHLHHSNGGRQLYKVGFFFILLYYCEVQMYINGYCCVYRKDLK